ncbi:MAG TPA: zinc ribbon domain-containing protein [Burkholderiales bacterium]|nr:zinc ribbon domain-containing protein [Burkholderiales bacterium]
MPIYEYHCRSCGRDFETLVRASEKPACVHCSGADLEKKLSVFAAQSTPAAGAAPAVGPCGTCGNPNGPGSCAIN